MRSTCLFAACGIAVCAVGAHAQQWWWPPGMSFTPECPAPNAIIEITLSGDWPNNCTPNTINATVLGFEIDITTEHLPPPGGCLTVITSWRRSIEVGPLPAGEYTVYGTHLLNGRPDTQRARLGTIRVDRSCAGCYPDCDTSTGPGVLDIFDFLCFGNRFAAGDPYACDCDTSTGPGVCDIFDFLCFGNEFNAGCP